MPTIAKQDRAFFSQGVNMYVPKMAYAADMRHSSPGEFSLGSPAAASATAIATAAVGNSVALTVTAFTTWVSDARYGRTLRVTPSADPGAAGGVWDIYGEDYLGQPMVERFSGANGATAILYGLKAFYRIFKMVTVTAATNAITLNIGTGTRLGLPYKGDVAWAKENGIFVPVFKRRFSLNTFVDAAASAAGGSAYVRAPCPGYVETLRGSPQGGGSTTNTAVTVELANTAIVGLTVTPDQDTATEVTDAPTTVGYNANNRFVTNGLIEFVWPATTGGGTMYLTLDCIPTHVSVPVLTDPQTVTTGDPRGTYDPLTAPDGSEHVVAIHGDSSYNASGNGGLHGIRHVIA